MSDIALKSEKIASAVYFITSFFADQEPLKWKLREAASEVATFKKGAVRQSLLDITNLLRIAKNTGLISAPNYELMGKEIERYLADVDSSTLLPSLATPIKDNIGRPLQIEETNRAEEKPDLKDFSAVSVKKNTRQSIIIGLLKRKREAMIKDITPLIHGCSEKTIQRELLSMVKSGILRKEGEKRWSRYSLA